MAGEAFKKNVGPIGKTEITGPAFQKSTPIGAGTELAKSDVSSLLKRTTSGDQDERRSAKKELVKRILEQDGDIHTKRNLLRQLFERKDDKEIVLAIASHDAGVKTLIKLATPSPEFAKRVNDSAEFYKRETEPGANKLGPLEAFDMLVNSIETNEAVLAAMKGRGARQGLVDAYGYVAEGKEKLLKEEDISRAFIYVLLSPPGQIPDLTHGRDVDGAIKRFLA